MTIKIRRVSALALKAEFTGTQHFVASLDVR